MIRILLSFLAVAVLLACDSASASRPGRSAAAQAATTTIYLVRHAEKADGDDPALTAEGTERAARLGQLLADSSLQAVYSTDYRRTRQTAGPAAAAHDLAVQSYDANDPAGFAAALLERHAGQRVLVVGHSNTIPGLAGQLSQTSLQDFADDDYGNLLIVKVPSGERGHLHRRRY